MLKDTEASSPYKPGSSGFFDSAKGFIPSLTVGDGSPVPNLKGRGNPVPTSKIQDTRVSEYSHCVGVEHCLNH